MRNVREDKVDRVKKSDKSNRKVTYEITEVNQILEEKEKLENLSYEDVEEIHLEKYKEKTSMSEKICIIINVATIALLVIAAVAVFIKH